MERHNIGFFRLPCVPQFHPFATGVPHCVYADGTSYPLGVPDGCPNGEMWNDRRSYPTLTSSHAGSWNEPDTSERTGQQCRRGKMPVTKAGRLTNYAPGWSLLITITTTFTKV